MDQNYWKKGYQDTWESSSKRENRMIQMIRDNTGRQAEPYGLGAGSTDFIPGSARSNGSEKGDADLHIKDTNTYVEVTGPLAKSVAASKPLWFRPDKFENAINSLEKGHDTFLVHHCPAEDLWRTVHIDKEVKTRYENGEFSRVHPTIRGRREEYVEIPANDRCVKPIDTLYQHLKDDSKENG